MKTLNMGYMYAGRESLGAIKVEGNSMEPRIHDGDIVVFVRDPLLLNNGCFAFVQYDGRLLIRAFYDDGKGTIRLRPLNPNYEDIEVHYADEEEPPMMVFGKLIRRVNTDSLADGV